MEQSLYITLNHAIMYISLSKTTLLRKTQTRIWDFKMQMYCVVMCACGSSSGPEMSLASHSQYTSSNSNHQVKDILNLPKAVFRSFLPARLSQSKTLIHMLGNEINFLRVFSMWTASFHWNEWATLFEYLIHCIKHSCIYFSPNPPSDLAAYRFKKARQGNEVALVTECHFKPGTGGSFPGGSAYIMSHHHWACWNIQPPFSVSDTDW